MLLNYLLRDAQQTLKQTDINIHIPEALGGQNFKLCVILGNLADNAISRRSDSNGR